MTSERTVAAEVPEGTLHMLRADEVPGAPGLLQGSAGCTGAAKTIGKPVSEVYADRLEKVSSGANSPAMECAHGRARATEDGLEMVTMRMQRRPTRALRPFRDPFRGIPAKIYNCRVMLPINQCFTAM